jgi:hypothetical protein
LPNGAPLRKLPVGNGFFGNRVVSVESWRQEPLWGGRGDVASLGRASDPLRHEARRMDELTGVIASEGPGSHAPASQPQKIAGNCRVDLLLLYPGLDSSQQHLR